MNKLAKYSKFFHGISFLCLCLPFFYTGCKETATEQPVVDVKKEISVDSTSANLQTIDSVNTNTSTQQLDETVTPKSELKKENKKENKEQTPSEILSKKYFFATNSRIKRKYIFRIGNCERPN